MKDNSSLAILPNPHTLLPLYSHGGVAAYLGIGEPKGSDSN